MFRTPQLATTSLAVNALLACLSGNTPKSRSTLLGHTSMGAKKHQAASHRLQWSPARSHDADRPDENAEREIAEVRSAGRLLSQARPRSGGQFFTFGVFQARRKATLTTAAHFWTVLQKFCDLERRALHVIRCLFSTLNPTLMCR